jgi:hypothetical protein
MPKTWQGELKRPGRASRLRLGFKNFHLQSLLRENDGRRKAIGAGADNASSARHVRLSLACDFIGTWRRRSAIIRTFLNPMKPAADQQRLVPIEKLQIHVNRVTVHVAIQGQVILGWPREVENGFPVFIPGFRERQGLNR